MQRAVENRIRTPLVFSVCTTQVQIWRFDTLVDKKGYNCKGESKGDLVWKHLKNDGRYKTHEVICNNDFVRKIWTLLKFLSLCTQIFAYMYLPKFSAVYVH